MFAFRLPGISANASRFQEFISGFKTIAPVTFYYENSPYADSITKMIQEKYFKETRVEAIKAKILEVSSFTHALKI